MASIKRTDCGQIRKERERAGAMGGAKLRGRENQKSPER